MLHPHVPLVLHTPWPLHVVAALQLVVVPLVAGALGAEEDTTRTPLSVRFPLVAVIPLLVSEEVVG